METTVVYQELSPSDWISITSIFVDIIAMLVGAYIAIWIVNHIQSKLDAEQKLKEYFLSEMKTIRDGYRLIFDEIYNHELKAQDFKNRMSSLSILSTDIMKYLKERYEIDDRRLITFQLDLNDKISDSQAYIKAYKTNSNFILPDAFENQLKEFEATSNSVFNEILVGLYKMD